MRGYKGGTNSREDVKAFIEDCNNLKKRERALTKREKDLLKKHKLLQREINQFKKQAKAIAFYEVLKARKDRRASEFSIPNLMFKARKKHRKSSKGKDQKCKCIKKSRKQKIKCTPEKTFNKSVHKKAAKLYCVKGVKREQRRTPYRSIQGYFRSKFRSCNCKPKCRKQTRRRCTSNVKLIETSFKNVLATCQTCITRVLCLQCTCHNKYKEAIYFRNCRCIFEGLCRHNVAAGDCFMPPFGNKPSFWIHQRRHISNPMCFEERGLFKNGGSFLLLLMGFLLCLVYLA